MSRFLSAARWLALLSAPLLTQCGSPSAPTAPHAPPPTTATAAPIAAPHTPPADAPQAGTQVVLLKSTCKRLKDDYSRRPIVWKERDSVVLQKPILFDKGSARLQPGQDALLQLIAGVLRAKRDLTLVEVSAFVASKKGDGARKLSQERANVVRRRLATFGVERDKLRAVGYGDLCPSPQALRDEAGDAMTLTTLIYRNKSLAAWGGCDAAKAGMSADKPPVQEPLDKIEHDMSFMCESPPPSVRGEFGSPHYVPLDAVTYGAFTFDGKLHQAHTRVERVREKIAKEKSRICYDMARQVDLQGAYVSLADKYDELAFGDPDSRREGHRKAIESLEWAMAEEPRDITRVSLGRLYSIGGSTAVAEKLFREVIANNCDPTSVHKAHYFLALDALRRHKQKSEPKPDLAAAAKHLETLLAFNRALEKRAAPGDGTLYPAGIGKAELLTAMLLDANGDKAKARAAYDFAAKVINAAPATTVSQRWIGPYLLGLIPEPEK